MKTLIPFLLILALAASASALIQGEQPYRAYDISIHGRKFHLEFFAKDVDGTPEWQLGQGEPPISPYTAYLKAEEAWRNLLPNLGEAHADRLMIEHLTGRDGKTHYYYNISFFSDALDAEDTGSGLKGLSMIRFYVLMDGRVIAPHQINKEVRERETGVN